MSGSFPVVGMEGFDHLSVAQLAAKGWSISGSGGVTGTSLVSGRYSGLAFRWSGNNGSPTMTRSLPSTYANFATGIAFETSLISNLSNTEILSVQTAAGARVAGLCINSSGNIFLKNAAGTTVATGTTTLVASTWYYLELVGTVGTSVSITGYLNGVSEVTAASISTGTTNAGRFQVILNIANSGLDRVYDVDDWYFSSGSSPLGDVRVDTQMPLADGALTQWSSSSGTRHNDVDETGSSGYNSDTDYISSTVAGQYSTFTVTALPTSQATVYGVQVTIAARKDAAATRQIAPVIRKGGVNYDGTVSAGLSVGYGITTQIYSQDPTSTDWTVNDFGAANTEFGVKEAV